jgi:hypothetical protein
VVRRRTRGDPITNLAWTPADGNGPPAKKGANVVNNHWKAFYTTADGP